MTEDRMYEVYCDIARTVYHREPISRERWEKVTAQRSYFRSSMHDDGQFDHDKDHDGDAQ